MSRGFNEARCAQLAAREGISFQAAAELMGRKGARKRREKRAQAVNERIAARQPVPWWIRDAFDD
jgi:hypothetical protein